MYNLLVYNWYIAYNKLRADNNESDGKNSITVCIGFIKNRMNNGNMAILAQITIQSCDLCNGLLYSIFDLLIDWPYYNIITFSIINCTFFFSIVQMSLTFADIF